MISTVTIPREDAEVIVKILRAASGAFRFGKRGRDAYKSLLEILKAPPVEVEPDAKTAKRGARTLPDPAA